MAYHFFGRYARVTDLETMVVVLDFTFIETASLPFLFSEQRNLNFMHSDTIIGDIISSRDG